MRKLLAVLLLSFGSVARSAAQEGQIQNAASLEAAAPESAQTGLVEEPRFVTKTINWFDRQVNDGGGPKDGFYPEFGNMITGSGWISAGPGYRHHLLGDLESGSLNICRLWCSSPVHRPFSGMRYRSCIVLVS